MLDWFAPAFKNIPGKDYDFVHDSRSQFSIITRKTCNNLAAKPPLQRVEKSEVGIDESSFTLDGVVYLHLGLIDENKNIFNNEYEPVLVLTNVTTDIFGMITEECFSTFTRDDINKTNTIYNTNQK